MHRFSAKVSMTVVKRLPKYYQYLSDLQHHGIEKISSRELSDLMGLTASQIRQDLSSFGGYGQQGYGYAVDELKDAIKKLLGLDNQYRYIIIGAGNMGRAIARYEYFRHEGILLTGIFDVDPAIVGTVINSVEVKHTDNLEIFIRSNQIDFAVLSVPQEVAQQIAPKITKLGINGILNFCPLDLDVANDVMVENVNITDSLFTLTCLLK